MRALVVTYIFATLTIEAALAHPKCDATLAQRLVLLLSPRIKVDQGEFAALREIFLNLRPGTLLKVKDRKGWINGGWPAKTGKRLTLRFVEFNNENNSVLFENLNTGKFRLSSLEELNDSTGGEIKLSPDLRILEAEKNGIHWSWYTFAKEYDEKTAYYFKKQQSYFREAKRVNDPHILFLERLGFSFDRELTHPPLDVLLGRLNAMGQDLIRTGQANQSDVLFPARVFTSHQGDVLYVRWGEDPPAGYFPSANVLSDSEFIKMVKAGFFPIGEHNDLVPGRGQTPFIHDLAHFSVFYGDPKFMGAYRKMVSRLVDEGVPLFSLNDSNQKVRESIVERLFNATETMVMIPPQNRSRLLSLLEMPSLRTGQTYYTVEEVETHLRTLSKDTINRTYDGLLKSYPSLVTGYGGSTRDLLTRSAFIERSGGTFGNDIEVLWLELVRGTKTFDDEKKIRQLARLQVGLFEFAHTTPIQELEHLLAPEIRADSRLYLRFCVMGLFANPENERFSKKWVECLK